MSGDLVSAAPDNNELELFITSTLQAIMKGISGAQNDAVLRSSLDNGDYQLGSPKGVDFDIGILAKRNTGANGGMKLQIFQMGPSLDTKVDTERQTENRIKFTVPIYFRPDHKDD